MIHCCDPPALHPGVEVNLAVGGGGGEVGHNVAEFDCHLLKRGSGDEEEVRDYILSMKMIPSRAFELLLYKRYHY